MKDWKKWLYPPWWVLVLLSVLSTAALIGVFVKGWEESLLAYITYVLSFYTLSVDCAACVKIFPGWYRAVRQRIYNNKFGNRYMTDAVFKTHVSLWLSLGINLMYVAVNLVSLYLSPSAWFAILAAYYGILAVMRFLLVRYVGNHAIAENRIAELKRARACACILLTLNLVLSGTVLMILYQNKGRQYNGMLIYVMAGYTFYMTIHAIVDFVKYRKFDSPVMSTAKIISLSAALVSVLSLETAMFAQFGGEMSGKDQRIMIAATGAGVSVVVVTLSAWLIVRATKEIRSQKYGKSR